MHFTPTARHPETTRFLVAADITAFAAGAEGGEHSKRVERALLFASLSAELLVRIQTFPKQPSEEWFMGKPGNPL